MKLRALLISLAIVLPGILAGGQTVTLTASNTKTITGALFTGQLCITPANNAGQAIAFQYGGGGQGVAQQACFAVTSGVLQSGATVPDTYLTTPQNLCLYAQLVNPARLPSARSVVGTYPCLQPASSGQTSWCTTVGSATTCNLDSYAPTSIPGVVVTAGATGPAGPAGTNGTNGTNGANGAGYITGLVSDGASGIYVTGNVSSGSTCPSGAPTGSVCARGQAYTPVTVSTLPAAASTNKNVTMMVSDGTSSSDCTTGGSTYQALCTSNGSAWVALGGGSGSVTNVVKTATSALAIAAGFTATVIGTAGTTTWGYVVVALNASGQAIGSYPAFVSTGNAALNSSNYNALSWHAVTGATSYNVYRVVQGTALTTVPVYSSGLSGCSGTTVTITFANPTTQSNVGPNYATPATATWAVSSGAPTGTGTLVTGGNNYLSTLPGSFTAQTTTCAYGVSGAQFTGGAVTASSPSTTGKIANTTGTTYSDQGAAGDGTQPAIINTSTPNTPQYTMRNASNLTVVVDGHSGTSGHFLPRSADNTTACRTSLTDSTCLDWPSQLVKMDFFSGRVTTYDNFATSGATVATLAARYAASVHPLSPAVTGNPGILFIQIGSNDIPNGYAATIAAETSYMQTALADGWILYWFTIQDYGATDQGTDQGIQELIRQELNDWTWAQAQNGNINGVVVDFNHFNESSFSPIIFQQDHVHETAAGTLSDAKYINQLLWGNGLAAVTALPNEVWPFSTIGVANQKTSNLCLPNITTGAENTCHGFKALWQATTPTYDSAMGFEAGYEDTTGIQNSYFGAQAGYGVTTGQGNTAVGFEALTANLYTLSGITGNYNTALGTSALGDNSGAATQNTGVGAMAGQNLTTGGYNTAVGGTALKGASGSTAANDTAVGYLACYLVSTASYDVCIGRSAGSGVVTASNDVYVGYGTGSSSDDGGYNTAVGNTALAAGSGTAESSDTAVGYGAGGGCATCTNSGAFGKGANLGAAVSNAYQIGAGTNSTSNSLQFLTIELADSVGNLYDQGSKIGLSLPTGTPTYTAGTNVTSCVAASGYANTNTRGELTIVGGTATTGTICTVNFSAALSPAPGLCLITQNGGATLYGIGHGTPGTSSVTVTAGVSVASATVTVDYNCVP